MKIYAHRGASGSAPENSMRAFRLALETGADGIELDLRATADGVPVVLHDRALDRTTSGSGNVDELTLAALREVNAGDGEPVPTFEDVLDLVDDRVGLDIEIKQPGIEGAVLDILHRHPVARWFISSFDWGVLRSIHDRAPEAELWPLASRVSEELFVTAAALGSPGVALAAGAYDEAVAARLAQLGLAAAIWTVNDLDGAKRARDLGAVTLITDEPAAMMIGLRG